jgi:sec-independent protein translocase protein TatB
MFGIGIPELILVALVALVVVGPKNLPGTLRALGRAIREFQRASRELRRDAGFDEVVEEVTRPLREGLSGVEEDFAREKKGIQDAVVYDDAPGAAPEMDVSMEYPESGPDDYGALPEGASVYPEDLEAQEAEPAPAAEAPAPVVVAAADVAEAAAPAAEAVDVAATAATTGQQEERS